MKFRTFFLSALFASILAILGSSCSDIGICVNGQGPIADSTLNLPAIAGIHISDNANLYISQGTTQEVSVSSQENILEDLDIEVVNDILMVKLNGCHYSYDMDVFVTLAQPLTEVSVSGSGDVFSDTLISAAQNLDLDISGSGAISLEVQATDIQSRISGSGDLNLSGTATNHELKISGSGALASYDLICDNHDLTVSGSGSGKVFVNGGSLDVKISGAGKIYYKGTPSSINTQISGSGALIDDN
ncbi:MAG: head GIN domain-containing protein [Bacteroidota bacterium]